MILIEKAPKSEKIALLIGHPIVHSVSPAMHNAAFKELNLPYEYLAIDVLPENLEETINELKNRDDLLGFNVTVPFKEEILTLLNRRDRFAEFIGAVNTVKFENDHLVGYNTDAKGFIDSLKFEANTTPKNKNILIIGAGGAARAIGVSLADVGAKSILFVEKFLPKAEKLARYIRTISKINATACKDTDLVKLNNFEIIVNASPVGMHPLEDQCPIQEDLIPKGSIVYDLVYNPMQTKLLTAAIAQGAKAYSGLDMLIRQGAESFKIWTGKKAPLDTMKNAALKILQK